jgi:hypothetical protein
MLIDAMARLVSGDPSQTPEVIAQQLETNAAALKGQADHPTQVIVNHRWKPALLLTLLGGAAIYWVATTARDVRRRGGITQRVVGAASQGGLQRMRWNNILLFVVPSVLIYTTFVIVPSLRAFVWSVHEWNGLTNLADMPYRGLLNFRRLLLESDAFWIALQNNLFLMVVVPAVRDPLLAVPRRVHQPGRVGRQDVPRRVLLPQPHRRGRGGAAVDAPVHAAGRTRERGAGGHGALKLQGVRLALARPHVLGADPHVDLGRVRVQHGAVPRGDGERSREPLRIRDDRRRDALAAVLVRSPCRSSGRCWPSPSSSWSSAA